MWALTSGDREGVVRYIIDNELELEIENVVFCEGLGVGKPYPIVHRYCLEILFGDIGGEGEGEVWVCGGAYVGFGCC